MRGTDGIPGRGADGPCNIMMQHAMEIEAHSKVIFPHFVYASAYGLMRKVAMHCGKMLQ